MMSTTFKFTGMDKMSTEEYYKAVNQRLSDIRNARKSEPGFDRDASQSYFESLNKRGNR